MNANEEIVKIIDLFRDPDEVRTLPSMVKRAFINSPMKPCSKWSFSNQILMLIQGTEDARGYQQWLGVHRYVKKGTKAIWILAPLQYKVQEKQVKEDGTVELVERYLLKGFKSIPVFRFEDTDGDPLPVYEPKTIPPLSEVAEAWGIKIRYEKLPGEYGHYNPTDNEIVLGTESMSVFFHELAHAAQKHLGRIKKDGDHEQEAEAELAAATLTNIYGGQVDRFSFDYIGYYGEGRTPEKVAITCLRILAGVKGILETITTAQAPLIIRGN